MVKEIELTNNVAKEERKWSVYRHTSPSGKVYIGITARSPKRRWENGKGYKRNVLFCKAIQKYGWDNIKHEVLFTGLLEERAKQLEINLIRHYKGLGISYNITDGGDGVVGVPDSPKRLEAVRRYWTGRHLSDEAKAKISKANKGNQARKGMHNSKEAIAKRLETIRKNGGQKRRLPSEVLTRIRRETAKVIPVKQYTLDGKFVAEYYSMSEAGRVVGIRPNNISMCCSGIIKQAKGYIWRR